MPSPSEWWQSPAREDGFPALLGKKHLEMPSTHWLESPDLKQAFPAADPTTATELSRRLRSEHPTRHLIDSHVSSKCSHREPAWRQRAWFWSVAMVALGMVAMRLLVASEAALGL